MKAKLRMVELTKDGPSEFPDNIIPVSLEPVIEHVGGIIPTPSADKFRRYYLEKVS